MTPSHRGGGTRITPHAPGDRIERRASRDVVVEIGQRSRRRRVSGQRGGGPVFRAFMRWFEKEPLRL